ncbi:MAG: hypothetical protein NTZ33_06235 [Bacteroidetes bacterium]|nr:hypothetical protein [Bacteroidota bacterium]
MLLNVSTTKSPTPVHKQLKSVRSTKKQAISLIEESSQPAAVIADKEISLTKAIGRLEQGVNTHYYSYGNFNLVRLIVYLLKQLGPSHVFLSSYSFSTKSIHQINHLLDKKQILSFKVLLDNRVRSISPKPFQMIATSFDYRCIAVHAKIALIYNDNWHLSIVTSQNATDNPKLERGIIFTDQAIFDFDYKILSDEFRCGTT